MACFPTRRKVLQKVLVTRNKANAFERKRKEIIIDGSDNTNTGSDDESSVGPQPINPNDSNGLGTGLRPAGGGGYRPSRSSRNVETFLFDLEKQLLDHVYSMRDKKLRTNKTNERIKRIFQMLKNRPDLVVARTDKTNSV